MTPAAFIDDPRWAEFLPEVLAPPRTRHLPTHEDCTPLEAASVAGHLRAGGTLGRADGYEERSGQVQMAEEVVRAFNGRRHLMVEAGTGTGKSLAYLIPAVQWAFANDTPVIVSTATRNLQSQLLASDIPRACETLGPGAADFKVALLKGRQNYLCLRAVGDFFAAGYWTMSGEEQAEMPHFIEWLRTTGDGDLEGYEGLPASLITCPGEECGGRRCPYYTRCFLYRARKAAMEAHLVVVNHALVLADAGSPGGILPAAGRLVLDEAHNLEDIATDFLSAVFSMPELTRLLNRLQRTGRGKRARTSGGILAALERQLARGTFDPAVTQRLQRQMAAVAPCTVRLVAATDDVLERAEKALGLTRGTEIRRYRAPLAVGEAATRMDAALLELIQLLHDLRDTLEASVPPDTANPAGDLATQVGGLAEAFVAFANSASFVLRAEKETHAYWGERVRPEKRASHLQLVAAPLSVADALRELLWEPKDSAILTSATLRVGNSFAYLAKRLGFGPKAAADADEPTEARYAFHVSESPFDYFTQALTLAADWLPDPSSETGRYADALAGLLREAVSATRGRMLVLFTSYDLMRAVAAALRPRLAADLRLLVQGEGVSRETMVRELKASPETTVLFGAQSFWEGVDVAGAALSCVVLTRLPFPQVRDPIVEARSEQIERAGGKSFRDYMLPEAVIRFRQGFGRLVRTKRDRGVVLVTDPRFVTKNYGARFRHALPGSVHTVTESAELLARVRDFLATGETP